MSNDQVARDEEKSVKLAKLRGWIRPAGEGFTPGLWAIDVEGHPHWRHQFCRSEPVSLPGLNLYDPLYMAVAWQMHLWTNSVDVISDNKAKCHLFIDYREWWRYSVINCDIWNSDSWQRAWLDKILQLAEEVGLI